MIRIHNFLREGECEYSGKSSLECVEISSDDGSIRHAVVCMAELTKLLRFRSRQAAKNGTPGNARASTPPKQPGEGNDT